MDAGFLTNKVILVLSPQAWGNMMLAKHHYALELAKRGNKVYFLNPPDNHHLSMRNRNRRITIEKFENHPNLFLINQQLFFPYILKFHSRSIYNILIRKQIRDILHVIGQKIDIVWSFDIGNLFPLRLFDKKIFKVFHPVDEPADRIGIIAGAEANILFSVTKEILEKYQSSGIPSYFVNHGLAEEFLTRQPHVISDNGRINIGMSGNLLRTDLDRPILIQIIRENPDAQFHFFGSYEAKDSNIGAGVDPATREFIVQLKAFKNVILHGVLETKDLSENLAKMDALLICYDIQKDQSRGTNYHKVMEYLSTGKVIISNNITTYREEPNLVSMVTERTTNDQLPILFKKIIGDLPANNAENLMEYRIVYAQDNQYQHQLDKMERLINLAYYPK